MTYFDFPRGFLRVGRRSELPASPPDRQSAFFAFDTGELLFASENMVWRGVNNTDAIMTDANYEVMVDANGNVMGGA